MSGLLRVGLQGRRADVGMRSVLTVAGVALETPQQGNLSFHVDIVHFSSFGKHAALLQPIELA
jgi:hypothetical protein